MWIVEGSCVYLIRGVSIRGKFVLSRNPEYKTVWGGGRYVTKRSPDPRVAYSEVKVQVRHPFAQRGVSIRGKFVFFGPKGENGHRRPVLGAASSATPRESQAKFRAGTVLGLFKGPVGTGAEGYRILTPRAR